MEDGVPFQESAICSTSTRYFARLNMKMVYVMTCRGHWSATDQVRSLSPFRGTSLEPIAWVGPSVARVYDRLMVPREPDLLLERKMTFQSGTPAEIFKIENMFPLSSRGMLNWNTIPAWVLSFPLSHKNLTPVNGAKDSMPVEPSNEERDIRSTAAKSAAARFVQQSVTRTE